MTDPRDWYRPTTFDNGERGYLFGREGIIMFLVELAEENRGLDHVTLKQLFNEHQVVVAVWPSSDGPRFLTLKGTEYLLAQTKRGTKKIKATTMTAFSCNSREHAEILQQAFSQ
jgi:hypothetical protein